MLIMTDILPTGYSTAMNARRLLDGDQAQSAGAGGAAQGKTEKKGVCVVIGCGPVSGDLISSGLFGSTGLYHEIIVTPHLGLILPCRVS